MAVVKRDVVRMHFQTSPVLTQRIVVPSGMVKHLSQPPIDNNGERVKVPGAFDFPHCFIELAP